MLDPIQPHSESSINVKTEILLISFFILNSIKWLVQYFYGSVYWPEWMRIIFIFLTFLIVVFLILTEKSTLGENHIDTLSLFAIIFFGAFFHLFITEFAWLTTIFSIIYLVIGIILIRIWLKKELPSTIPPYLFLGMAVGFFISLFDYLFFFKNTLTLSPAINILYMFLYQLSNVSISEEALFRGFLWGSLRRRGFSSYKILFIQAFLFMIFHINPVDMRSLAYYLSRIIMAMIMGLLAWKSKSILPGILTHAFHNTFVSL